MGTPALIIIASCFVKLTNSFAPKDDPKIALSVYVEHGGQGARAAAAIAGLMIEKYICSSYQEIIC